jgi:hypothetical protein
LLEKHMNTKFHTTLLAAGFALTAMSASAVAPDVIDARQETQIWTTFVLNPYLRNNDLHAVVKHGAATLTGNVAEGVDKELASTTRSWCSRPTCRRRAARRAATARPWTTRPSPPR